MNPIIIIKDDHLHGGNGEAETFILEHSTVISADEDDSEGEETQWQDMIGRASARANAAKDARVWEVGCKVSIGNILLFL